MEGTRTIFMSCFLIDFSSHIEIREPRGGDENYMPPMSFISFHNIEIREPRGGDENLSFSVAASDVSDGLR